MLFDDNRIADYIYHCNAQEPRLATSFSQLIVYRFLSLFDCWTEGVTAAEYIYPIHLSFNCWRKIGLRRDLPDFSSACSSCLLFVRRLPLDGMQKCQYFFIVSAFVITTVKNPYNSYFCHSYCRFLCCYYSFIANVRHDSCISLEDFMLTRCHFITVRSSPGRCAYGFYGVVWTLVRAWNAVLHSNAVQSGVFSTNSFGQAALFDLIRRDSICISLVVCN